MDSQFIQIFFTFFIFRKIKKKKLLIIKLMHNNLLIRKFNK